MRCWIQCWGVPCVRPIKDSRTGSPTSKLHWCSIDTKENKEVAPWGTGKTNELVPRSCWFSETRAQASYYIPCTYHVPQQPATSPCGKEKAGWKVLLLRHGRPWGRVSKIGCEASPSQEPLMPQEPACQSREGPGPPQREKEGENALWEPSLT